MYASIEYEKETTRGTAPQLPALGTVIDTPLGEVDVRENLGEPSITEGELSVARLSTEFTHKFNDNWQIQTQFLASLLEIPEEGFGIIGTGLRERDNKIELVRVAVRNSTDNDVYTLNTNVIGEFNTGKNIKHEVMFGAELASQKLDDKIVYNFLEEEEIDIFDPVYQPRLSSARLEFDDSVSKIDELGLYLQDQIDIGDNLIFILGARYNIADTERIEKLQGRESSDRTDTNFSPRAGIFYQPADNVSLYASYTESFLPNPGKARESDPGTGITVFGEEFEPETGRQFEVGVKAELSGVLATLAFYDLKRSNVLDQQTFSVTQIGEQKSQGIELDIAGEILPGWNIIASYAYTDTEILENERLIKVNGELQSLVGNKLRNVPEHSIGLWTTYRIQQGGLEGLGFGLGFVYESEKQGDLANTFSLPGYFRTDAALYYETGKFKAQLNVENLFDIRYFESSKDEFRVNPGAPFSITGTVSLEF